MVQNNAETFTIRGLTYQSYQIDKGNIIQINKCQDILTFPSEY